LACASCVCGVYKCAYAHLCVIVCVLCVRGCVFVCWVFAYARVCVCTARRPAQGRSPSPPQVYPLESAPQAHADLESRGTTGKLLLKP
jgi:hypothetical protein